MPFRTVHTAISRYLGWPLFGRRRPVIRAGISMLPEHLEWLRLTQMEAEARQLQMIRKLIDQAAIHVPHYRETFGSLGISGDSIKTLADLERLPALDRKTLQSRYHELCTERKDIPLQQDASGGSSGLPVIVFHTAESAANNRAAKLAADMIAGYRLGGPMGSLWGGQMERQAMKNAGTRLLNWATNTRLFDTFNMDEARMLEYHRALSRYRPDVLLCYASSLHVFARFLESSGLKPSYPTKGLITSAETLTPSMRTDIGRVFDASIFDRYGSREVGIVGMECEVHDGLHVIGSNVYLEVVDPASDRALREEPGEALVTVLRNYGMPLIRYRLGDYAVLSDQPCRCGRPGPMIKKVLGRMCDTIRLPSGRLVHGEYFTHLIYGIDGLTEFRFVQNDLYNYDLLLVTDERYDARYDDKLKHQILELAGPRANARIQHVEKLELLPSGKRQFVFSHLGVNPERFDTSPPDRDRTDVDRHSKGEPT